MKGWYRVMGLGNRGPSEGVYVYFYNFFLSFFFLLFSDFFLISKVVQTSPQSNFRIFF